MKKTSLAVGIILTAMLAANSSYANDKWRPQRKAIEGCTWKAFNYKKKGLKLWYQNCSDPDAHYELSWKDNVLEEHRPSDDATFNGPAIIELFQKPDDVPVEQVIADKFINKLSDLERENCKVIEDKEQKTPSGVVRYKILPTTEYEQAVVASANKENPDGIPYETICGDHGKSIEGEAYFEYHPAETAQKFIYVNVGQDDPLFDQNSIRLNQ